MVLEALPQVWGVWGVWGGPDLQGERREKAPREGGMGWLLKEESQLGREGCSREWRPSEPGPGTDLGQAVGHAVSPVAAAGSADGEC